MPHNKSLSSPSTTYDSHYSLLQLSLYQLPLVVPNCSNNHDYQGKDMSVSRVACQFLMLVPLLCIQMAISLQTLSSKNIQAWNLIWLRSLHIMAKNISNKQLIIAPLPDFFFAQNSSTASPPANYQWFFVHSATSESSAIQPQ